MTPNWKVCETTGQESSNFALRTTSSPKCSSLRSFTLSKMMLVTTNQRTSLSLAQNWQNWPVWQLTWIDLRQLAWKSSMELTNLKNKDAWWRKFNPSLLSRVRARRSQKWALNLTLKIQIRPCTQPVPWIVKWLGLKDRQNVSTLKLFSTLLRPMNSTTNYTEELILV